jgi:hypothetical protein
MARWPAAIWQPGSPQGGALKPIAVTLHHQAGSGNPAGTYARNNVSAHFWLPRNAQPVQHVDTAIRAYHGVAHNGYGLGVETEGCGSPPHADPLTERQLNDFAALMRWANQTHGIPLVLSERVDQPGLNYHRCQGGPATACPCQVRVDARAEILRRAGSGAALPGSPPPAPTQREDHNMVANDKISGGQWIAYPDGAVHTLGGAPFLGASNDAKAGTTGKPCIGIAPFEDGYVLIHEFGTGEPGKRDPRAYHFRR